MMLKVPVCRGNSINLTSLYFSLVVESRASFIGWLRCLYSRSLILIQLLIRAEPGVEATIFAALVGMALMVVSFILNIERCHDRDKSGWFAFVGFIPVLGPLWLLLELGLLRGTRVRTGMGPTRWSRRPTSELRDLPQLAFL